MNKKEFDMRKKLIELDFKLKKKLIELELKSRKEIEDLKFNNQLEVQRIRSAEIKRTIDRKSDIDFINKMKHPEN